jgi:hypothetical protein
VGLEFIQLQRNAFKAFSGGCYFSFQFLEIGFTNGGLVHNLMFTCLAEKDVPGKAERLTQNA